MTRSFDIRAGTQARPEVAFDEHDLALASGRGLEVLPSEPKGYDIVTPRGARDRCVTGTLARSRALDAERSPTKFPT